MSYSPYLNQKYNNFFKKSVYFFNNFDDEEEESKLSIPLSNIISDNEVFDISNIPKEKLYNILYKYSVFLKNVEHFKSFKEEEDNSFFMKLVINLKKESWFNDDTITILFKTKKIVVKSILTKYSLENKYYCYIIKQLCNRIIIDIRKNGKVKKNDKLGTTI